MQQRGYFPAAGQLGQMGQMGMMRPPQPRWNNAAQGQYPRGPQPGGQYQQQMQPGMQQQGGFRPQRAMRPPMGGPRTMQPGAGQGMGQQMPHQQQGPHAMQQQQGPARPQQNGGLTGPGGPGGLRTGAAAFVRAAGQPMTTRPAAPAAQHAQNISGIDPAQLAKATSNEQKQILGEKLFPLVSAQYPDLAGKVTGMLLEIDNSELLLMLEQPEQLKIKVDEAVNVLKSHLNVAPGPGVPAGVKAGAGDNAIKAEGQK